MRIHTLAVQQPHGHVPAVAQHSEQQMPRLDLAAARALRLRHRHLNGAARVRRQALRGRKVRVSPPHRARDELARLLLLHAGGAQGARGRVLFLAQHPEQQMLAAHISVSQLERRRLRAAQHPLGPRAESFFPQGIPLLSVQFSVLIFSHFL